MTESKWLACSEPSLMLEHLSEALGKRKRRLFACACYRRLWELLDPSARLAVEAAEEGQEVGMDAAEMVRELRRADNASPRWFLSLRFDAVIAAAETRGLVGSQRGYSFDVRSQAVYHEGRRQCALLRCIVGNPFRPVSVPSEWRTWNDGTLVKMARAIYDDRRWNEMPILADALEDAGCADVLLLDHCRTPAEHARGCHVLDVLLDLQ